MKLISKINGKIFPYNEYLALHTDLMLFEEEIISKPIVEEVKIEDEVAEKIVVKKAPTKKIQKYQKQPALGLFFVFPK